MKREKLAECLKNCGTEGCVEVERRRSAIPRCSIDQSETRLDKSGKGRACDLSNQGLNFVGKQKNPGQSDNAKLLRGCRIGLLSHKHLSVCNR